MLHPYEIEEREYHDGPKLWDASVGTPGGACCAAFQLGACEHTEAFDPADFTDEELAEFAAENAIILATVPALDNDLDDEPF